MSHDSPDPHGDGSMGSHPSQANFIGWLAIGLLAAMGVFTILVLLSATMG